MHSIFVKVILITGLALAAQNVMAKKHHPHCGHQTCCWYQKSSGYYINHGDDKRCIAKSTGMWTTCGATVCMHTFDGDLGAH